MRLEGTVKETVMHGALVDIGLEMDGVVHISQLAPTHTNSVTDVVQPGDKVTVWITKVDKRQGRIGLTMVEPPDVEWRELAEGQVYTGAVTRIEPYGAFVDFGAERPGLLHVREMSTGYVRHPSDLVQIGKEIEVRILKLNRRKRRIDLTMSGLGDEMLDEYEPEEVSAKTTMEIALQRAQSQQSQKQQPTRHNRKRSPDLSARERILARTLEQHSQHEDL
jgi:ribosomal protein S1